MRMDQWFLTADERGNPGTRLDSRHADGSAWSAGNDVTVLATRRVIFRRVATERPVDASRGSAAVR